MSFETFQQYPPVDGALVDRIVCKLKSQGIFDQFRKDCLADVDTKPAYQNLQQRVNGTVATFLATQTWQQDLNKTQLRESLRRHVQQGFLEVGVDRIVDQVVNPKVFSVFMPKVEDVVYDCLGIEKPKHPPSSNNTLTGRKLTLLDLLPKDLDPVSPDSDNLSFDDDDETKDETNNNESLSKLDMSNDSQVSGISDLSSHMGDSFKDNQENNVESSTAKSAESAKENSNELHFENFENLSEKIKQAEIVHNSVMSLQPDEPDSMEPKTVVDVEENNTPKDNKEDMSMEIESISNSTFEDTKMFTNKIIKEDTCSRTMSEDSMSCSSFNAKLKKEKKKSSIAENSGNSLDKVEVGEVDIPCKEFSLDNEVKAPPLPEDIEMKTEVIENKEPKKSDESKDKKHRDSSSSSSKAYKNSSDKHKPSESKHRSSYDKKDDFKQTKEKTNKDDKDKERVIRDERDKSSRHKEDRHHSSKDKYRDKDKSHDKNKDKDNDKKKDRTDSKDNSEKDKKDEKEAEKDKYIKDKEKTDKEKPRHDKENYRQDKEKYKQEKDKQEKDKSKHEKEKDKYDKEKHDKSKRDREKLEKEKSNKYDSKDKDRDRNEKEKDKSEKDRSRDREKGKNEKDKESSKSTEARNKEEKKKESKKHDKQTSSSSLKKDDSYKNETKDRNKRSDENSKEKGSNNKVGKSEEERRERKRKAERCNDEIKLKEARRSWDRDSSGGNGRSHGSHKASTSEYKAAISSGSSKEKEAGEPSNQQKTSERTLVPVSEAEEPSDVDKILMKINSSIEESQNIDAMDEQSIKKPKIARNIFEIKKIMQARKNLARQMRHDKKKRENSEVVREADATDSPSTTQSVSQDKREIREENKENIKTGQLDKMKSLKVCPIKGKFTGFLEADIEKSRSSLQNFRTTFFTYCSNMGLNIVPTDGIDSIDFSKVCDFSEELLDDNLNKLKPKSVSLERRKTYPEDNQVNKAVENLMSGMNGCYVLLQDCTEVVEAMRQQQTQPTVTPMKKTTGGFVVKSNPPKQQPGQESSKTIGSATTPKKTPTTSGISGPVPNFPQIQECVVELGPEVICSASHLLKKQDTPLRKVASSRPTSVKQQPKQELEDGEPSSPGIAISVALNPFLNDSVLNDIEKPPSVTLTEAMLDNLMRESSVVVEDEGFEDSDDSDHEYVNQCRDSVKKLEVNQELFNERELIKHITPNTNDTFDSLSNEASSVLSDGELTEPLESKVVVADVNTASCDIVTPVKGSSLDACENKSLKRRNQRLCRSASQRYDSTDLYKPRPVLPQNAKRVRAPRSVSSEDLLARGQYEISPPKKRAR